MAWSYSGNPGSSKKDEVRFLVGDTQIDYAYISDEEILYLLSKYNQDAVPTAIDCCKALVARFASEVSYSIGPEKVSAEDRFKHYRELLKQLKQDKSQLNAGFGMSEPSSPLSFDLGMHDNR